MRTLFDKEWFARLLAEHAPQQTPDLIRHGIPAARGLSAAEREAVERRQDWGEAPDVLGCAHLS